MGFYSGYACDKCGIAVEYMRDVKQWLPCKTYLTAFARKEGWSIGKNILCPKCRKGVVRNG